MEGAKTEEKRSYFKRRNAVKKSNSNVKKTIDVGKNFSEQ